MSTDVMPYCSLIILHAYSSYISNFPRGEYGRVISGNKREVAVRMRTYSPELPECTGALYARDKFHIYCGLREVGDKDSTS